jgi:hypothetical protein
MPNKDVIENLEFCLYKGRCTECSLGEEKSMLSCRALLEDCRTALKNSVEVVRCKDCKFSRPLDKSKSPEKYFKNSCVVCECETVVGDEPMIYINTHFCSYGERKES